MFARHTHARRMKKTGVVQGLKSLADKIHPNGNAPLTISESKRLLTALTSSFRKHLDAAHPTTIENDRKKRHEASGVLPNANINNIHSSAVFAQKHMASVLTNPLLVRGAKGYGSAKVELQKNPYRDPIELLEEYEREGAASVRVAELCMENVKKEYDSVPDVRKPKLLEELRPGRRVFIWLLESGKYASADYADNVHFIELLVFFLFREGREENIWSWLKVDVQAPDSPEGAPQNTHHSTKKRMLYKYRWRGRVLGAFIHTQVCVPWRADASGKIHELCASSLNSALNTFFTAVELRVEAVGGHRNANKWHHMAWLPLGHTATFLVRLLTRRLRSANDQGDVELRKGDNLNPQLFDKLIDAVPHAFSMEVPQLSSCVGLAEAYRMIDAAALHVAHPTRPSADPTLKVLRVLFPDNVAECPPNFKGTITRQGEMRHSWHYRIIKCAHVLAMQGRHEEAEWARARIPLYFPELARYSEKKELEYAVTRTHNSTAEVEELHEPTRIPFPTFA